MTSRHAMIVLLLALMGAAIYAQAGRTPAWRIFLYGIPLFLIGCLLARQRWALMGGVMYGTVGLALDIATAVQTSGPDVQHPVVLANSATGLLNVLLILAGGRGFLNVSGPSSLPESPRPNPPSRSSS